MNKQSVLETAIFEALAAAGITVLEVGFNTHQEHRYVEFVDVHRGAVKGGDLPVLVTWDALKEVSSDVIEAQNDLVDKGTAIACVGKDVIIDVRNRKIVLGCDVLNEGRNIWAYLTADDYRRSNIVLANHSSYI